MQNWLAILSELHKIKAPCVLVTVAHTVGSAPRECGAKMIISREHIYGTIGGGKLEYQAIHTAREHLININNEPAAVTELYVLGPMLEQCCGGVVFLQYEILPYLRRFWKDTLHLVENLNEQAVMVTHTGEKGGVKRFGQKTLIMRTRALGSLGNKALDLLAYNQAQALLQQDMTGQNITGTLFHSLNESKTRLPDYSAALLFEVIKPCDFHITLFGAGHVGTAIVSLLDIAAPCRIDWVDSRDGIFPKQTADKVTRHHLDDPVAITADIPAHSYCLIMTHSHIQDFALCEVLLGRDDIDFIGLIGSQTKKQRFIKRMQHNGISSIQLSRLICPIGIKGISSKTPEAIAVSVVAQLLQQHEQRETKSQNNNEIKKQTL